MGQAQSLPSPKLGLATNIVRRLSLGRIQMGLATTLSIAWTLPIVPGIGPGYWTPAGIAPGYSYNPATGRVEWYYGNIRTATTAAALPAGIPCSRPLGTVGFSYPRTTYTGSYLAAEGVACQFPGEVAYPRDRIFPPRNFKPATVPEIWSDPVFKPLPSLAPKPGAGWKFAPYKAPDFSINPGRWARVRPNGLDVQSNGAVVPVIVPRGRPPRNVKEIKVRSRAAAAFWGLYNAFHEAYEILGVFAAATGYEGPNDPVRMAKWIAEHWQELDLFDLFAGLAWEMVEDIVAARVFGSIDQMRREWGWLVSPDFQLWRNSLRN